MKTVIVTGGSGKIGSWIVRDLLDHEYNVLNVDRQLLNEPRCRTLLADMSDAGQVFNALSTYTGLTELDPSLRPHRVDAILHLAAIPRVTLVTDNEVFRINVMSTYHVLDVAAALGVPKVIFASSEAAYGMAFSPDPRGPEYFPLEEEYPVAPIDAYGLSKVVNEQTGRAFQLSSGADIYALRISDVMDPNDYATLWPHWLANPESRTRLLWSYIDVRDLGQICRSALETDGLGFQVFNAVASDTSARIPTSELLQRFYPTVPLRTQFDEYESLISNQRVRELLGFEQKYSWRDQVTV